MTIEVKLRMLTQLTLGMQGIMVTHVILMMIALHQNVQLNHAWQTYASIHNVFWLKNAEQLTVILGNTVATRVALSVWKKEEAVHKKPVRHVVRRYATLEMNVAILNVAYANPQVDHVPASVMRWALEKTQLEMAKTILILGIPEIMVTSVHPIKIVLTQIVQLNHAWQTFASTQNVFWWRTVETLTAILENIAATRVAQFVLQLGKVVDKKSA
jgi:hypothetical protein